MTEVNEALLGCRILIVEDDVTNRLILKHIFAKHGFTNIEEAVNGRQGMEKIMRSVPDLIVADIQMPQMDGFDFCRRVRAHPDAAVRELPILVQTALTGSRDKAKIFSCGASDYVSKPVDELEMIARVNLHLERELMTRKLRDFNSRVRQELDTARSTQHVLIPSRSTIDAVETLNRVRVHEHFQSCSELGGDFWTINMLSAHEFALATVDFSGHGVNAALNVFRLHALMHASLSVAHTPSAYLTNLNAILAPLLPTGQFATMFYGIVNTEKDTLSYASAAAPSPVVFRKGGGYAMLDSSGMLLGIKKNTVYETRVVPFERGDCLLLYSDALIETPDRAGRMLGTEQAATIFQSGIAGDASYKGAFDALFGAFSREYMPALDDDLTLVAVAR